MREAEARETVERLRELLARGATLREAAGSIDQLGGSPWRAHRLAAKHDLPRRRRRISREKERAIASELAAARLTLRQIAQLAQVSPKTVWLRKIARDGPGPRPCRAWRCPTCGGLVVLTVCILDGTPRPEAPRAKRKRPA
jgi:hypothetical protein